MTLYALGATTIVAYRLHTGDQDSAASAVSGALIEAETLLEEELRRLLALEARTEKMRIHPDGRVYPKAWPVTVAVGFTIDGRSLLYATPDAFPFIGSFAEINVAVQTITYTGGFDTDTLPKTLENAIYDLARAILGASSGVLVAVGASSITVGDVSISYPFPSSGALDASVPGLTARVTKYRNRWA